MVQGYVEPQTHQEVDTQKPDLGQDLLGNDLDNTLDSGKTDKTSQEKPQLKNIEDVHEKLDEIDQLIREGKWEEAQEKVNELLKELDINEKTHIPPQTRKYLSAQLSSIKKEK